MNASNEIALVKKLVRRALEKNEGYITIDSDVIPADFEDVEEAIHFSNYLLMHYNLAEVVIRGEKSTSELVVKFPDNILYSRASKLSPLDEKEPEATSNIKKSPQNQDNYDDRSKGMDDRTYNIFPILPFSHSIVPKTGRRKSF